MEGLALASRTPQRLPALVLAWTLALLITPALASACSGATTSTFTAASGDWSTAANWSPAVVPTAGYACIPAGKSVTVTTAQTTGDLEVDATASLAVVAATLTVGPGTGSLLEGDISINTGGTLELASNTVYDAGTMDLTNSGFVQIDATGGLQLDNGVDVQASLGSPGNAIVSDGTLVVNSTGAAPTSIDPVFTNNGTFSNSGPVTFTGGSGGTGDWNIGSGAGTDEPTVTLTGNGYDVGNMSDQASGGLGHVVLDGVTLTLAQADSLLSLYQLDVASSGGFLDFTPTGTTTAHVNVSYLTLSAASDGMEIDAPASFGSLVMHGGTYTVNAPSTAGYFHFGGGTLANTLSGGKLTVQTFDPTDGQATDSGSRAVSADLVVQGAGTQDYVVDHGTWSQDHNITIASGVRWPVGDIAIAGGGTITNHGVIDHNVDTGTGADIQPQIDNADGEIRVSTGTLTLDTPPVQYDGTTLTAGRYVLTGTLQFFGAITTMPSGVEYLGPNAHLQDTNSGGGDARNTVTSNPSGNTATLAGGATLAPPSNFTNSGTINLSDNSAINLGANSYTQSSGATRLGSANSLLTATGGVNIDGGTLAGVGTITGPVSVAGGTVAPGNSPGTLNVTGNYTQSGGILATEVDGPNTTDYDRLIVSGTATLSGGAALLMQSTNGYEPPNGQTFDVIQAGTLTGAFSSITQYPSGTFFEPLYGGQSLRLVANSVSIGDATANEGNASSINEDFTVTLGQPTSTTTSVDWATQDGSAAAGSDYTAASGTVTFAPGETTKTVSVTVSGDTAIEPDENFVVNLTNPVGTRIRRRQGVGTITNDDSPQAITSAVPAGDIDGFPIAPPPVQGKKVNIGPVSGKVLVKLPGKTKFVPLPDVEQVPVGTTVDATKGVVRLFSVGKGGKVQSAIFYQGVFQVLQKVGQALTREKLVGGSFTGCPKATRADASAKRRKKLSPKSSVRELWGSGAGQFQTEGRYASATIRGTKWLTNDLCNGTQIKVAKGAVTVHDLTLKKAFALKAPKSYVAPAVKPKKRG